MLDSLGSFHNKREIAKWLLSWLNNEWKKYHDGGRNIFNGLTMHTVILKGNCATNFVKLITFYSLKSLYIALHLTSRTAT
jgi:hypothetical protein